MKQLVVVIALFACCAAFGQVPADVDSILGAMPANDMPQFNSLCEQALKGGPAMLDALCAKVLTPGAGDDAAARFAVSGVAKYVTQAGKDAARLMVSEAFLRGMATAQDPDVKGFFMEQLALVGKDECIAPISAYLSSERLCDDASFALQSVGGPTASAALAEALPSAQGKCRVSLITALGNLREGSVAQTLLGDAKSEDKALRDAALFALARLGTPEAAPLLEDAVAASSGYERSKYNALLLAWRAQTGESGRSVIATEAAAQSNMRCAELSALVQDEGKKALDDLIAAMNDGDLQVRAHALELAASIPGKSATKAWVKKAGQVSKEARIEIISMLGRRGDAAAMKMLLAAIGDTDKDVCLAAVDAATLVGGPKAVSALLDRMKTSNDADEIAAIKAALLRVPGDKMPGEVGRALPAVTVPARQALLDVLAARRASGQFEMVLKCTDDPEESVRVSALKALAGIATPNDLAKLLDLLLAAQAEAEINAAVDSYVAVAAQMEDAARRDDLLVPALAANADALKPRLMKTLAGLGGEEGLAAVTALAASGTGEVKDAAVRALADWPDYAATAPLLDVARATDDLKQNVLALRGYQRLVGAADISPEDKVRMYVNAMEVARRSEEKTAILGGLAGVRTLGSLQAVAKYLDDDALKGEAALSSARIACPKDDNDPGLKGAEVLAVLQKALPLISDADMQAKAQKHIDSQAGK